MLAARHQAKDPKRLVLAYRQEGFCQMGGLFRIAQEVVTELRLRPLQWCKSPGIPTPA